MNWNRETLKGDFSLANSWFKDNREKIFCIGLWLEMRIFYDNPKKKKYYAKPGRCHRPQHQHHGRTFMIRRSCSIFSGTKRSCLLWAAETCWFHYGRLISAIDSFEPCIARKTAGIRAKTKLFFFMTTLGLILLKS